VWARRDGSIGLGEVLALNTRAASALAGIGKTVAHIEPSRTLHSLLSLGLEGALIFSLAALEHAGKVKGRPPIAPRLTRARTKRQRSSQLAGQLAKRLPAALTTARLSALLGRLTRTASCFVTPRFWRFLDPRGSHWQAQASGIEEAVRLRSIRLRPVVVLDRLRLEGKAFIEFGERDRDADFRHV
jgi:hypothetical protein